MKLTPFVDVRPSNISWLGDIPSHWTLARSDEWLSYVRDQIGPEAFEGQEVFHYSIPVVQEHGTGQLELGDSIASAKQPIREQLLLVSKLNPRKSTICIAEPTDKLTVASTEFVGMKGKKADLRFLCYLMSSEAVRQRLDSVVQSVTRSHQRANPEDIWKFWWAWPSQEEQVQIVGFLDRETAKIDELIQKKRELIERLKEKRTALISHVVTKGLPPEEASKHGLPVNPPLKPSGVPWLGDAPDHWAVTKLKFLGRTRYGLGEPPEYVTEGLPLIRATDIYRGKVNLDGVRFVNHADVPWSRNPGLIPGEIIVVRSGAYTGDSAIIPAEVQNGVAGFDMVYTATKARPEFIAWLLLSGYVLDAQLLIARARAAQPHLNADDLGNVLILAPPLEEQLAIADYIRSETGILYSLAGKVEEAIGKMQEYRSALITAAVTGKIDVREPAILV